MYEASIERQFRAAHALRLADGQMEPMHAHDWHVTVTVAASQLDRALRQIDPFRRGERKGFAFLQESACRKVDDSSQVGCEEAGKMDGS